MHATTPRPSPSCSKCALPLAWHSVQEVHTRDRHRLMQVFKCEHCDRLEAFGVADAD